MTFNATQVFNAEFDKAIAADVEKSGFPVERWFKNGPSLPLTAVETWRTTGPEQVRQFIRWFEGSGQQVWVTPDGRPAIELELSVMFGDVEVRGFIDFITLGPAGLTIVDTKSGSRKPDSLQQLAIYACMVELAYGQGWRPLWGTYFLGRGKGPKGAKPEYRVYFQPPVPLSEYRYSVPFFTRELEMFEEAVQADLFVARPGPDCDRCGVSYACLAVGGTESRRYDPADPDWSSASIHDDRSTAA